MSTAAVRRNPVQEQPLLPWNDWCEVSTLWRVVWVMPPTGWKPIDCFDSPRYGSFGGIVSDKPISHSEAVETANGLNRKFLLKFARITQWYIVIQDRDVPKKDSVEVLYRSPATFTRG